MNPGPTYHLLSERMRLLAHPERLRILDILRRDAECVCHLEALLGKPQPYVSQQLRLLRDAGVIGDEKRGQNVFYSLIDRGVEHWLDAILGPAVAPYPGLDEQKRRIRCDCPKCEAGAAIIELDA